MKIANNKVVEFIYELEVEGQIVDHTVKERPFDYIHGTHSILPKLEECLEGMEPGGTFDVVLSPEEGYGVPDPARIIDLPKAAFEINGEMRDDLMVVGNTIPLINAMGGVVPGIILEVGTDSVKVDTNHRMAGKTLHFTGEVLAVRDASEKELTEGLHGEYVQGGCGGHKCGGCHGHGSGHCHDEGHECGGHCHDEGGHECHCKEEGEGHGHCHEGHGGGHCHEDGEHECHCHEEGSHECNCHKA